MFEQTMMTLLPHVN